MPARGGGSSSGIDHCFRGSPGSRKASPAQARYSPDAAWTGYDATAQCRLRDRGASRLHCLELQATRWVGRNGGFTCPSATTRPHATFWPPSISPQPRSSSIDETPLIPVPKIDRNFAEILKGGPSGDGWSWRTLPRSRQREQMGEGLEPRRTLTSRGSGASPE